MPPRSKKAVPFPAPEPTPDISIHIGHPILPGGLSLQVTVPITHMEGMIATLLEWIHDHESAWAKLPTDGPDVIPGGVPTTDTDLFAEARRQKKVGF